MRFPAVLSSLCFAAALGTASPALSGERIAQPRKIAAVSAQTAAHVVRATPRRSDLGRCVARGVAYHKAIGAYPTIPFATGSARDADVVAIATCRRSLRAFRGF